MLRSLLEEEELLATKIGTYAQHEEDDQVRQLLQEIQNIKEQHVDRLRRHLEGDGDDSEQL